MDLHCDTEGIFLTDRIYEYYDVLLLHIELFYEYYDVLLLHIELLYF